MRMYGRGMSNGMSPCAVPISGGAKNLPSKLIEEASTRQSAYDPSVLSLMTPGDISQRILNCRVPIDTLGMHQGLPGPSALAKLAGVTRRVRPDIIIGWMHHAVLAAKIGRASCRERVCQSV